MAEALEKDAGGPSETRLFNIALMGGTTMDITVNSSAFVRDLRAGVEEKFTVPPASYLKLVQDGQVLLDDVPIGRLDNTQPVFGAVSRETSLEVLLQAASSYWGYHDMMSKAQENATDKTTVCFGPVPTIVQVLEDMGGEEPKLDTLCKGKEDRMLEFSGEDGHLLLPSIDAAALLKSCGVEKFTHVTISVEVNSDAYNRGLGVVLEASSMMDSSVDEHGLPKYIYNGYGISEDKKQNAVKFHPGMRGGQLRIEGIGGWGNSDIGFTPKAWTASSCKFHTLELTLGADGTNEMCIEGTEPGQVWRRAWTRQLTDGRYFPALYAWLDMGSKDSPLHVGGISFSVKMP